MSLSALIFLIIVTRIVAAGHYFFLIPTVATCYESLVLRRAPIQCASMHETMKHGRASKAHIAFDQLPDTQRRGVEHNIIGEDVRYDLVNGHIEIRVIPSLNIPLQCYQGASTLNVQIDLDDESTTLIVTGGRVLGGWGSDGRTVFLRLSGAVTAIQRPDH
jgi:hypothetical protein